MDTAIDNLDNMAETFKLLGDRTRLAILGLLREKELCVCNIVDILQISQPVSASICANEGWRTRPRTPSGQVDLLLLKR